MSFTTRVDAGLSKLAFSGIIHFWNFFIMRNKPTGMLAFVIIWVGQVISLVATNMTQFGLTIWIYQQTNSATALGLMNVFFITPFLIISPFAGVMIDRHNRKLMMMISDLVAGLATIGIFTLQALGHLQFWHLYISSMIFGLGNAFQWPAYSAAISTMIPKEQLGRANGMMGLLEMGPNVLAPLLAGALLPIIGLTNIMLIDIITFLFAVGALLLVYIPQPPRTAEGEKGSGSVWKEAVFGFQYIFSKPGLLGLQLIFFTGNLFSGIAMTVFIPMILTRTGNNSLALGTVETVAAVAGVVGGVALSAWGGFKRRVHGVLAGWIVCGFLGTLLPGIGHTVLYWSIVMALAMFFNPIVNASSQSIWQAKVAPDIQGRVFSARRLIAWFTNPISPIIAGTLADFVLEPAMRTGSGLSQAFGWLVGSQPGSGMGLLMVFCGIGVMLAGMAGYFSPAIRNVEDNLPDHI
jgi:MFS transporter, DHA3 family, macrolide efflux protein